MIIRNAQAGSKARLCAWNRPQVAPCLRTGLYLAWARRRIGVGGLVSLLFSLLILSPRIASAQATGAGLVDARSLGGRVDLPTDWLFATGDNPADREPGLDDSHWTRISTRKELESYHIARFESCWYRLHVQVHPDTRNSAFAIENVSGSYEVFVNGVRLGGYGAMPPRTEHFEAPVATYPIPEALVAKSNGALVLALHFTVAPSGMLVHGVRTPFGAESSAFLATPAAIARDASYDFAHHELFSLANAALFFLSGVFVIGLFLALRQQREYLALGTSALAAGGYIVLGVWIRYRYNDHSHIGYLITMLLWGAASVANLEFVRLLVRQRRGRLLASIEIATFLDALFGQVYLLGGFWSTVALITHLIMFVAGDTFVLVTLSRGWRRRNIDARLVLPAWLLTMLVDAYTLLGFGMRLAHAPHLVPDLPDVPIGSYTISILTIINFIYVGTLIAMIMLRTIRISRDRAAAASEIAAAQSVQQVLLARVSEPTPGFRVEIAYQPASEVGGDFFFLEPGTEGSLIAIVGDVSGKGMLAAMRVSMILGVLRREESREPDSILHSLNEVLLTQGDMGFTTACCVRLDHGGHYLVANAGHISPYVGGRELETPGALPLGMVGDQQYDMVRGVLGAGETLVLMSDGVVEARSPTGELYGFERLPALTLQPAQEIANVARRFGQEDDITVLTIACGTVARQAA